jgi:hypothetical protein
MPASKTLKPIATIKTVIPVISLKKPLLNPEIKNKSVNKTRTTSIIPTWKPPKVIRVSSDINYKPTKAFLFYKFQGEILTFIGVKPTKVEIIVQYFERM